MYGLHELSVDLSLLFRLTVLSFVNWCNRAVPISLFAEYTDTACTRLFKQPIPIMRPIMRGRL